MGERSRGGLCRPCLCAGRPGSRLFSTRAVDFLTLLVCLGVPPLSLGGFCLFLGPAARMGGPVNQVLYLPSAFLQGRRSGLFHLIHRLGVGGGLLSGPFALYQFLTELGGHLAADIPYRPPAALAFPLDLIAGVPFPWFWYGLHLRFASHGEIYFSTWFNASAIPAIM